MGWMGLMYTIMFISAFECIMQSLNDKIIWMNGKKSTEMCERM